MTTPALSTALLHMLYAESEERAMEWARRVVRYRFEAGEYPLVSMLDEGMVEALAKGELRKRDLSTAHNRRNTLNMNTEPQIKPTDPEAATYRTDIKGWVSRSGHYFGNDASAERVARFNGSTVGECADCRAVCEKSRTRCDNCQAKKTRERYDALPLVQAWDWPLALFDNDSYFFDADDLESFCDSNEVEPESLMLVTCEPNHLREVEADYWEESLTEDGELPKAVADALDAFNAVIREHGKAISYGAASSRVEVTCADIGWQPRGKAQA